MQTESIGLLELLAERASYINTYWNFYIVVATAILGVFGSGHIKITRNIRNLFSGAFILFAFSNLHAIIKVNEQRLAIYEMVPKNLSTIAETFKPNYGWVYITFHLLLDILVVISIFKISQRVKN